MNALVDLNKSLAMSSREIAALLNSRHRDVCTSINRLMDSGAISGYAATPYTHEQNQQVYFEFFVSKRDSYVIVAQLSPAFTARLVDRWQELEAQASTPSIHIPKTFAEALRMAADQAEQIEQQQFLIEQQKPAVEFVGKFVTAGSGNMTFRAVAKILKINERELRQFLSENKIMYKLGGDWVPLQNHIDAGRFEVKAGLAEHEESSHAFKQSKFTPKGVEWLAGEYAKHQASKAINAGGEA